MRKLESQRGSAFFFMITLLGSGRSNPKVKIFALHSASWSGSAEQGQEPSLTVVSFREVTESFTPGRAYGLKSLLGL